MLSYTNYTVSNIFTAYIIMQKKKGRKKMEEQKTKQEVVRAKNGQIISGCNNPTGKKKNVPPNIRRLANESLPKIQMMIDDPSTPPKTRADLLKWTVEQAYGKARVQVDLDADVTAAPVNIVFSGVLEEWSK